MAELTETELVSKLNAIDTQITTITDALTGANGAAYVDYQIGNKRVDASQKLEQLRSVRGIYQDLLEKIPKTITRDHGYAVDPLTGADRTDYVGDE